MPEMSRPRPGPGLAGRTRALGFVLAVAACLTAAPTSSALARAASVRPGSLLVYYAWPSVINGATSPAGAASHFGQYTHIVLGDGIQDPSHPDYANTVAIVADPAMAGTTVYGYVDLGVITQNLSVAEVQARAEQWSSLGVDGIFLDDFGYDFQTSRDRQNAAVAAVHALGLVVVANAFFPEDALGSAVDPTFNPTGAPSQLGPGDFYFYESHQTIEDAYVSESAWRAKADAVDALRQPLGVEVLSITTTATDDPGAFDEGRFFYSWYSALLHGHAATGWGEFGFSASGNSNGVAPFRPRPLVEPGTVYLGPVVDASPRYTRRTDSGQIVVDAQSHAYAFISGPAAVAVPALGAFGSSLAVLSLLGGLARERRRRDTSRAAGVPDR